MKQGDLAQAMKVVQSVISKVESDQTEPTADFCISFAAVMGLTVEYVLAMAGKPGYESFLNGEANGKPAKSPVRRAIEALLARLTPEEQQEAIDVLDAFTEAKRRKKGRNRKQDGATETVSAKKK